MIEHGELPGSFGTETAEQRELRKWMDDVPPTAGPAWWRALPTGRRRWMAGSLFGAVFLIGAIVDVFVSTGSVVDKVICLACILVLAAMYIAAVPFAMEHRLPVRIAVLGAMVAIVVPIMVFGGVGAASLWIYPAISAAMVLPIARALGLATVLAVAMCVISGLAHQGIPYELAFVIVALTAWMGAFAGNIALTLELRRTRQELADSAVANERARIGRDLHDILGHTLTAITVKAGLAQRLVERDPAAARREIADIERLAREAVGDVRSTAAGIRDVSLAGELAVAGAVLRSAGFVAELPSAVDDVTPQARELFGYVVRESVTNVVRHSGGTWCAVVLTPESVTILDNGRGKCTDPVGGGGHGLSNLSSRVEEAGGVLEAGPRPDGGFRVAAILRSPLVHSGSAGGSVDGRHDPGPGHPVWTDAQEHGLIGQ